MIDAYRAETLGGLLDVVELIQETLSSGGWTEHLWFRGQRSVGWEPVPSAHRRYGGGRYLTEDKERGLANDFYVRARRVMSNGAPPKSDYTAWLALMQHYGAPTRLLDWSESPLIAAYFATEEQAGEKEPVAKDACIWVLRPGHLNSLQGDGHLYPLDSGTAQRLARNAFAEEKPGSDDERDEWDILACYSVGGDLRMNAQQSCFTLHRSREVSLCGRKFDECVARIVIPAASVSGLRRQLRLAGVTERFVFPDLEHVAKDVRSMYGI